MNKIIKKIMFNNKEEELFYQALRIRLVEEKIIELYPFDKIQSPIHLSIGQEAIAVGISSNLSKSDLVFINYRGHAFYLAKGGSLNKFYAELYGKKTGYSKGKAGSMHLADPSNGVMGASAVVAASIPHAIGSALVSKIQGKDDIFVAVFGDGATEQGVYHESLNFASLHDLNILFLCENNTMAANTKIKDRHSYDISKHSLAYNINSVVIPEGYDCSVISDISREIISNIRKNRRPFLIEINTCRYKEHVGPGEDPLEYRQNELINNWKQKDPLINNKVLIDRFTPNISKEIDEAIKYAEESPWPDINDLLTDVA